MQLYRQCVLKEETHLFRFPTTSTFSSFFISTRVVLLKYFHPSRFFVMRPMRTHKRPECNFYWCRVESVRVFVIYKMFHLPTFSMLAMFVHKESVAIPPFCSLLLLFAWNWVVSPNILRLIIEICFFLFITSCYA